MRRSGLIGFLLILSQLILTPAYAQLYNFKNYNTKSGLANSFVNIIIQSPQGYIWFGTQGGGISRFDGKEFKSFTKEDGLISNDVTALCEDKNNNLWVGTAEGISKFDGKNFTNYVDDKSGIGRTIVYSILCDREGVVWFATFDKGLILWKNNAFSVIDEKKGLPTNATFDIFQDKKGDYWVGLYEKGFCKINSEGKILEHTSKLRDEARNQSVFSISQDPNGNMWFGTAGSGLYEMKNGKLQEFKIEEIAKDIIAKIVFDSRENTWVATEHGLLKINKSGTKLFAEKDGLPADRIQAAMVDYEGNLWVGTQGGGVSLFKNEAIVTYTDKDGLSNTKINSVFKTSSGLLLTGSFAGLFTFENGVFKKFEKESDLINSSISSIFEDSKKNVWVGTENEGLLLFEVVGGQLKFKNRIKNSLDNTPVTQVMKIMEDRDGAIWFTCYGHGLFKLKSLDNIVHYHTENGLASNEVINVYQDRRGSIWVTTYGAGVQKFNGKSFEYFKNQPPSINNVFSIADDEKGNVFFGSFDAGLTILNTAGEFKTINKKSGLCANNVQSVLYEKGNLWIGTDKGINKIKLNPDLSVAKINFYNENDGFKSAEVNSNAIYAQSDGVVWFGTTNGLTRYNPNFDYPNKIAPKLILSDIKLLYEHVDWSLYADSINPKNDLPFSLKLSYKNNNLTFNFQAATTDNIMYQFMLDGLADDWSPPTAKNEAGYTNIPPGKYIFKVKAFNSNGIWSEEVIEYAFEITPPFWRTWWFYTICGVVAIFALVSFMRWRTEKLEQEKKILEQKVEARTIELQESNHKLFDALHDIKDSINYAEKIQRAILPTQETIHDTLPDSFILFRPRDVVSGDFYWFSNKEGIDYIAAVDCTGHGVPGAFMSMVGSSLLNEIVLTKGISDPKEILSGLNQGVQDALKQNENQSRDGMDMAFCTIDAKNKKIRYAGANRPLWIIRNNKTEVEEVKATKTAIGGFTDYNNLFVSHDIQMTKGDTIYLFTDGFPDQFGGANGKKLMSKKFKESLLNIQKLDLKQQGEALNRELLQWMGDAYEQVDDILVVGVRF